MSLQVWIPLNGNLNNYGLDNSSELVCTSAMYTDGKLGKCLNLSGYEANANVFDTLAGLTQYSFSLWLYVDSTKTNANYSDIFAIGSNHDGNTNGIRIEHTATLGAFQIIFNKSESSGVNTYIYYGIGSSPTLAKDKWLHIAVVNDGTKVSTYFDGELVATSVISNIYNSGYITGSVKLGLGTGSYARLNDIRIYDHALSVKEIKEISKGLVCHYRLSGVGGENLVVNSGLYTKDNPLTSTSSSKDGIKIMKSLYMECTPGETYTFQCKTDGIWGNHRTDGLGNGCTHLYLYLQTADEVNTTSYKTPIHLYSAEYNGKTGKGVWTYTVPTTYEYVRIIFRFDIHSDGETSYTVNWWDLKAEKGTKATPWCPNPADELYSTLGFDDVIEYDCSGYGNDGEIVGNITYDSDSPRYSGCYEFEADSSLSVDLSNITLSEYTISFWAKHNEYGKIPICAVNRHFYWFGDNSYKYVHGNIGGEYYYQHNAGTSSEMLGKWVHYVCVYNGSNVTIYRNGINEGSQDTTGTANFSTLVFSNGFHTESYWFYGNLSDFRIYATALSEDSIKELFQSPISLSSDGCLLASEFEEGL